MAEESQAFKAFRDRVMSQPQVLTDFAADPERRYSFRDGMLYSDKPMLHEFATFTATKVVLHGKSIEMEGVRSFVTIDSETHRFTLPGMNAPMKVRLTIENAHFDEALAAAAKALFFGSEEDAAAAVPAFMAKGVPAIYNQSTKQYEDCKPCAPGNTADVNVIYEIGEKYGVTPPRLTHQVDPDFHPSHFKGIPHQVEALFGMIVDTDGIPREFWLTRPIGTELDRDGLKAVSQYRFAPAAKDGKPVPVRLNVAVNFQLIERN